MRFLRRDNRRRDYRNRWPTAPQSTKSVRAPEHRRKSGCPERKMRQALVRDTFEAVRYVGTLRAEVEQSSKDREEDPLRIAGTADKVGWGPNRPISA